MKRQLWATLLLLLFFTATSLAEEQVLAKSGNFQLTASELEPTLQLLSFLAQDPLSSSERQSVVQEMVEEFQDDPAETLQSLNDVRAAFSLIQGQNDPMMLGDFRQQLLGDFHKMALETAPDELTVFVKVLNHHAPVIAYDPNTEVALTQKDLVACLLYMQQLGSMQGESYTEQDLVNAGLEVVEGFQKIDAETQKMLASGSLLISLYENSTQKMTANQKNKLTTHYRTTMGGPPTTRNSGAVADGSSLLLSKLADDGARRHEGLMKSLQESGESTDFWTVINQP